MDFTTKLRDLPRYVRISILAFLITLSFGYFTGLLYVEDTTDFSAEGIQINYNGNESMENDDESFDDDEIIFNEFEETEALSEPIKFKKSEQEIITIIHTHVLSFSLIFFTTGILLCFSKYPIIIKKILIIEPFISIILTFGGIWLLWKDIHWMKYIVMISGMLLTIAYITSTILITYELFRKKDQ